MMSAFVVMVQDSNRWVDSIWIEKQHAIDRMDLINRMMKAAGFSSETRKSWFVEARVEDAVHEKTERKAKS